MIEEIFEDICNGEVLLFCGAGFSYNAFLASSNKTVKGVEDFVNELKRELGEESEEPGIDDLKYYSNEYNKTFGEAKLVELLKKNFYVNKISSTQEIIGKLPWRRIYTTNYDNVLELSTGRQTVTVSKKPNEIVSLSECIIHLNGSILDLTPDKINNELKLTTASYLSEDFINSTWHQMFLNDIRSCKKIIFIGFSLEHDLDLARAINKDEAKNKVFFINKNLTKRQRNVLSDFGKILDYDSEKFSIEIDKFSKNYTIPKGYNPPLYTFEQYEDVDNKYKVVESNDILNLLVYGKFSLDIYLNNTKSNTYLFDRNYENDVYESIVQGDKKIIVIHSGLGNGKRIFVEKIKFKLKNFAKIYSFNNIDGDYYQDLENIFKDIKQNKILIFENYNKYIEVLKKIESFNLSNTFFILTARSYIHDLVLRDLERLKYFDINKYGEYNLNSLNGNELNAIVKYIDSKNLWGEQMSLPLKKKRKILETTCDKKISLILLHLFNSENILTKLNNITEEIGKNKTVGQIFLLSLINKILNLNLSTTDLKSILNLDSNFSLLMKREKVMEVLNYSENKIGIESSLLASYLLKQFNKNNIIDMLIFLMKKCDRIETKKFKDIKFTLISFSNFQVLVGENNSKNARRYYEEIQNLNYCKKNIYFWIQYANVEISMTEFDKAQIYLKNALSYSNSEEKPHYQTCKARYLLEKQLHTKEKDNAFGIFYEANQLLYYNRNEESRWHFPFKHVSLYKIYYSQFFNTFDQEEKSQFLLIIGDMLNKLKSYIDNRNKEKLENLKKMEMIKKELISILKENNISF